jgi:RNA polymerase sigma-70 factor (ECF subfamily)
VSFIYRDKTKLPRKYKSKALEGAADLMTVLLLASSDHDGRGAVFPTYVGLFTHRKRGDLSQRKQVVELYDEIRPPLYGYLSSLRLQPHEAEDIIQETFLRFFHYLVDGGSVDDARGWAFRVAHNLSLNLHRDERHLISDASPEVAPLINRRPDPALNPEEALVKKEQVARIELAASHLTAQQQYCLHLRAEGLRYREIADVLGISIQRVADLVQRALTSVAGEL